MMVVVAGAGSAFVGGESSGWARWCNHSRGTGRVGMRGFRSTASKGVALAGVFLVGCGGEAASPDPLPPSPRAPQVAESALELPEPGDRGRALVPFRRAMLLLPAGQRRKARERLDRALKLDPAFLEARVLRAQISMEPGPLMDLPAALEDARIARLLAPEAADTLMIEGIIRFHLGDSERARPLLELYLQQSDPAGAGPSRVSALEILGKLQLRNGETDAAQRSFEEARALDDSRAELAYGMARVAAERGDTESQDRFLEETVALDPHHLAAHHDRYRRAVRRGNAATITRTQEIQALLRQLQDDTSLEFAQDHERKAALWGRLAELLDGSRVTRREQLRELVRAADWTQASAAGESLLAAGERHPEVLFATARAQARVGRRDAARATVARLAEADPPVAAEARAALLAEVEALGSAEGAGADGR